MKYVMFKKKRKILTVFHPVIFSNHLAHSEVAEAMLKTETLKGFKVDSAGEYDIIDGTCSGKSITLNVKSKPERDKGIINTHDYGGGMK